MSLRKYYLSNTLKSILPFDSKLTRVWMGLLICFASQAISAKTKNKSESSSLESKIDFEQIERETLENSPDHNEHLYANKRLMQELEQKIEADAQFQNLNMMTLQEQNCKIVREHVESMPFNVDASGDDGLLFTKITNSFKHFFSSNVDTYVPISYRTLAYRLLQSQSLLVDDLDTIQSKIKKLRETKQDLIHQIDQDEEGYVLLFDNNEEKVQNAVKTAEGFRAKIAKKTADLRTQEKFVERNKSRLETLRKELVDEDPLLEGKVQLHRMLTEIGSQVEACSDVSILRSIDLEMLGQVGLSEVESAIEELVDPMSLKTHLHSLRESLTSQKMFLFLDKADNREFVEHEVLAPEKVFVARYDDSHAQIDIVPRTPSQDKESKAPVQEDEESEFYSASGKQNAKGKSHMKELESVISETDRQIKKVNKRIKKVKENIKSEIAKIAGQLKSEIETEEYSKYTTALDDYRTHIKLYLQKKAEVIHLEEQLDKLELLIEELGSESKWDFVIPEKLMQENTQNWIQLSYRDAHIEGLL